MQFEVKSKKEYREGLSEILKNQFSWDSLSIYESLDSTDEFLNDLQDDIYIGIEYPYVDKLYRNLYYHYYSSKLYNYPRNCIRLSFFSCNLDNNDFFDSEKHEQIKESFLGFLVLRPTYKNIIGRNILHPNLIKKNSNYRIIFITEDVSINGLALCAKGFPHSSQDGEMMACAETTLWSVIEYFSSKYPEHKQILPSDILKILRPLTAERQLPSDGLLPSQISYVLKKIGFEVKNYIIENRDTKNSITENISERIKYNNDNDNKDDNYDYFTEIVKDLVIPAYVESGIPVLVTVIDEYYERHIFNVIGRVDFNLSYKFERPLTQLSNGTFLYNYYELPCNYLSIDDNLTPYHKIDLNQPTKNRLDDYDAYIDLATVPMHKHIYTDITKISNLIFFWLEEISKKIDLPPSLVFRTFLSSAKSYKDYIIKNELIPLDIKKTIITLNAPKYLWIIELSTFEDVTNEKASGIIIADATEPKEQNPLCVFINKKWIIYTDGEMAAKDVSLQPFKIFTNNLNIF
jgi:hypothetical protein